MLRALAAEIAGGRIRAFGVRNWSPDQIRLANAHARGHGLARISFVVTTELSIAAANHPRWPGYVSFECLRPLVAEQSLAVLTWIDAANLFVPVADRWAARWDNPGNRALYARLQSDAAAHGISPRQLAVARTLRQAFPVVGIITPGESCEGALEKYAEATRAPVP
jgi:aryl-alcohol dehydrogenase-like predicted oxidoreductase